MKCKYFFYRVEKTSIRAPNVNCPPAKLQTNGDWAPHEFCHKNIISWSIWVLFSMPVNWEDLSGCWGDVVWKNIDKQTSYNRQNLKLVKNSQALIEMHCKITSLLFSQFTLSVSFSIHPILHHLHICSALVTICA